MLTIEVKMCSSNPIDPNPIVYINPESGRLVNSEKTVIMGHRR